MKLVTPIACLSPAIFSLVLLAAGAAEPVKHSLLATGGETRIVDSGGKTTSKYPASTRDGWVLPNGNLLLARRLVERGVRFTELTCPAGGGDRWDQHSKLRQGNEKNSLAVDQPIAGLLRDLKGRGLLDSTLVVWGGEFGRTPFAQGTNGRDHNPFGFTMWLAGGGVKGGTVYGTTGEYGYKVVENRVEIHDLHATMFHLLGINHEKLTFRFSGRDIRLTDVYGEVLKEILV